MDRGKERNPYPGVIARGNSIQISFSYKGERQRETLPTKPTKTALKEAALLRDAIRYNIKIGTFDYAEFFPNSEKARKWSKTPGDLITIKEALTDWIVKNKKQWQLSTLRDYSSSIYYHLIPTFGHLVLNELKPSMVKGWMAELECSNKRINNILVPLRQAFKEAFINELIDINPLLRVKYLKNTFREPKPFTASEIKLILNQLDGQNKNLIQFAFWTGLRTSELIALRWQDIDLEKNKIHLRQAKVLGHTKSTKTCSGIRDIDLQPQAKQALLDQTQYTSKNKWVFLDPNTGLQWTSDQPIRKRVWIPALKSTNTPYRNPYQTRHTFASMMLSAGKNPLWLAHQMGHKDWGMIRKTYGRWLTPE